MPLMSRSAFDQLRLYGSRASARIPTALAKHCSGQESLAVKARLQPLRSGKAIRIGSGAQCTLHGPPWREYLRRTLVILF